MPRQSTIAAARINAAVAAEAATILATTLAGRTVPTISGAAARPS